MSGHKSGTTTTTAKPRKRRMKRKMAAIAAGIVSIGGVAGASVLVQNFMAAEFNAGAPPCLIKVAGADTSFDGFAFDATGTTLVDGVAVTQEVVTIDGLTGDKVTSQDVYRIENNCAVDLDVSIVSGAQSGDWAEKYLEVWLGDTSAPTNYPGVLAGEYDTAPLIFEAGGPTNATTGTVTVPAGTSVPVGMIVTTGAAAVGTGDATWTVQAEMP